MRDGGAGAERGGDHCGLGEFLLGGAGALGVLQMDLDAVGALRGQGDADSDQFLVLAGDRAVLDGEGVELGEGTEGVGRSANSAVVMSSVLIFILDLLAVQITGLVWKL